MSITTRTVYTPPTLPTLGAAGYQFVDPTFGSRMVRVTDADWATAVNAANISFHTSASGYQREWNADGTKFWVTSSDGWVYLVSFNPTTLATARIGSGLLVTGDVAWSDTDPNILYGTTNVSPNRTLVQMDCSTVPPTKTTIVDLGTLLSATLGGNVGAMSMANGNLFCIFGATQDNHQYVLWYPLANPSTKKILQTKTDPNRGADGAGNQKDARLDVPFGMHSAQIDKAGRYISIIPGGSQGAQPVYFWDTTLDTVTAGTGPNGGHEVLGFGRRFNEDTISGSYDSRKWVYTPDLLTPNTGKIGLPVTPLSPVVGGWGADHSCWNNATAAVPLAPIVVGSYRYGDGPGYATSPVGGMGPVLDHLADSPSTLTPWRPWDDEIISVPTDGTDLVYRHCHTRSFLWRNVPTYEPASNSDIFYYTPRPNVSRDGRWAVFSSNWEKTLGTAAGTGIRRVDVFLVELTFDPARDGRVRGRRPGGGRFFAR